MLGLLNPYNLEPFYFINGIAMSKQCRVSVFVCNDREFVTLEHVCTSNLRRICILAVIPICFYWRLGHMLGD